MPNWKERFTAWIWRNPVLSALVLLVLVLVAADGVVQALTEKHLIALIRESRLSSEATVTTGLWGLVALAATVLAVLVATSLAAGVTYFRRRFSEATEAFESMRAEKRTVNALLTDALKERHQTQEALKSVESERDAVVELLRQRTNELAVCQRELGCARLDQLAARIERTAREQPDENAPKVVTVRYLDLADYNLAEHIVAVFRRHARWTANAIRDATSHITQETPHRVVFESGNPQIVKELSLIFNFGNIIGEPTSPYEIIDRQTTDPTIRVTIFPKSS